MQVLIDIDAETLERLEAVAPARSRKRSAFIRAAIQKSLAEAEEAKTRRAYLAEPDLEALAFDPSAWEPAAFGGFDPPRAARTPKTAAKRGRARTKKTGKPRAKRASR